MADSSVLSFFEEGQTVVSNLLLHHYHDLGMTTGELVVYLEFKSYADRGVLNPEISQIANHLQTSTKQVFDQLQMMIDKHLCDQRTRQSGGKEDVYYDFSPLLLKLAAYADKQDAAANSAKATNARETIFNKIEVELGRMLTPMEMQIINGWLDDDHYSPDVIDLALREAVMNSAVSLKYMDRILTSWQHQNLTTPEQIEQHEAQFEAHRAKQQQGKRTVKPVKGVKIPLFSTDELWQEMDAKNKKHQKESKES